jgi:Zn-dependent protease with chaperone function
MLSVKYTGNPNDLATALLKLQRSDTAIDVRNAKRFDTRAGYLAFHSPHIKGINMDTHPPIEERVKRLISVGASIQ